MTKKTILILATICFAIQAAAICDLIAAEEDEDFQLPEPGETTSQVPPVDFTKTDNLRPLRELDYSLQEGKSIIHVVVSDRFSSEWAGRIYGEIATIVTDGLCEKGSELHVWNGSNLMRVASFSNLGRKHDCSPQGIKFRIAGNKPAFAALNRFFTEIADEKYTGPAALDLPGMVDVLHGELHESGDFANRIVVFYGSATELDLKGGVSFADAYPTVGLLRSQVSAFSTRNRPWHLAKTAVHFVTPFDEDFTDTNHRRGMKNWIAAYFLSQGAAPLTSTRRRSPVQRCTSCAASLH